MNATVTHTHFTLNFAKKTIVGTQNSFNKAGKGYGPLYEELAALMEKHPTYEIEVKKPEKAPKTKQTYKGMDINFMIDYASAVEDTEFAAKLEKVKDYCEKSDEKEYFSYPVIKHDFLEHYAPKEDECFDYDKAKDIVRNYRIYGTTTTVDSHTKPKATPTEKVADKEEKPVNAQTMADNVTAIDEAKNAGLEKVS